MSINSHFDKTALEFMTDWVPEGFEDKRARRPKKAVPDWVMDDKQVMDKICKNARFKYNIIYLHWRLGWTAKEIAEQLLGSAKKFHAIELILFKLRKA